jgi:MtN3 and saliva related transmembrane protein
MEPSGTTVELVGGLAAICTTGAFLPQLFRVWRLRRADEISAVTFLVFAVGTGIWLAYGLLIGSVPIVLANAATIVIASAILALKFKWDRSAGDPPKGPARSA